MSKKSKTFVINEAKNCPVSQYKIFRIGYGPKLIVFNE